VLMATQHPDSTRYVPASEEVEDAINAFSRYLCDEVMVDYEGKLTPYHQPEWIVERCRALGIDLGYRRLITVRIPNDRLEDVSRHMHSLLTVFLTNARAARLGLPPPICYVVLPMFENPLHASSIQRRLIKLQMVVEEEVGVRIATTPTVIPLLEDTSRHLRAGAIAEAFRVSLIKNVGMHVEEMRIFLGKSDAALESGHLASTVSMAVALSSLSRWSEEEGIAVYPILGVGKPPFRGFLEPRYVDLWVSTWSGYRTVTIQSALRYDTPYDLYLETVQKLIDGSRRRATVLDIDLEKKLRETVARCREIYRARLGLVIDVVRTIAANMPRTRDRLPPTSYGRGEGLPRAITFTATCYTVGIPPTILDLEALSKEWRIVSELPHLEYLVQSYRYDMSYLSEEIASLWIPRDTVAKLVEVVKHVGRELGLEPSMGVEEEYWKVLRKAWEALENGRVEEFRSLVLEAAKIRGYLG